MAVKDLEGSEIPENALKILNGANVSDDIILPAFAGILHILKQAFRFPSGTLKQDVFTKELLDLK